MIGCRRVLERACKAKLGDAANGKNLYDLIDAVLANMETTKALSDWAHDLRQLGNDAVHGDDTPITKEDAKQAYDLTVLLVDLLFSYPNRIAKMRQAGK
ncbi:DUF4145 domain-containing protein [Oxalobacter vibrioformis]|uniref:DUF4145 domain-containing protein n=1 Tax=Oxalobacter vibrioformis TaxID=933080 RepID=UPI0038CD6B9A